MVKYGFVPSPFSSYLTHYDKVNSLIILRYADGIINRGQRIFSDDKFVAGQKEKILPTCARSYTRRIENVGRDIYSPILCGSREGLERNLVCNISIVPMFFICGLKDK